MLKTSRAIERFFFWSLLKYYDPTNALTFVNRIFVHKKNRQTNVKRPYLLIGVGENYHFIITLPQVKPLPKAAKTTVSPDLILPCSHASVSAIGIEAAVVLPYF